MLVLSTLHALLNQVLALPQLHTAALLTPSGQLIAAASDPERPKDRIRVAVGLAGEVWAETKDARVGMVESELGKILVLPVDEPDPESSSEDSPEPFMLLALNATDDTDWDQLQVKGQKLVEHLQEPIKKNRAALESGSVSPSAGKRTPEHASR